MLFDPTERNVNPLLFQTGIRTVKELVLALAIHDQNVTMTNTARVNFTVRTKETMSFGSLHSPNSGSLSLCAKTVPGKGSGWQPSAHLGFIRGAIGLHTPASSGQQRPPVCDPTAGPRDRPRCEVRSCPYSEHSGKTRPRLFSFTHYRPPHLHRKSLPGPGSTGVTKRVRGGNPDTAHLPLISCS